MSLFPRSFLLLLVITLLSAHNAVGVHVYIKNSLDGNQDLTLHCKSADSDLGVHLLHPGAGFGFNFGISFVGHTQYYCSFQWPGGFHYFDIYIASRDHGVCETCNWYIKQTGPCRVLSPTASLCYPWNK